VARGELDFVAVFELEVVQGLLDQVQVKFTVVFEAIDDK